jgi:hypothetical protein
MGKVVWWDCRQCGHTYQQSTTQAIKGYQCPNCAVGGYKTTKPGVLYVLCGTTYGKVGISNVVAFQRRLTHHYSKGLYGKLVMKFEFQDGRDALNIERVLKQHIRETYGIPRHLPEGFTEAFPSHTLPEMIHLTVKEVLAVLKNKNVDSEA